VPGEDGQHPDDLGREAVLLDLVTAVSHELLYHTLRDVRLRGCP
jgi:hypothetical protein